MSPREPQPGEASQLRDALLQLLHQWLIAIHNRESLKVGQALQAVAPRAHVKLAHAVACGRCEASARDHQLPHLTLILLSVGPVQHEEDVCDKRDHVRRQGAPIWRILEKRKGCVWVCGLSANKHAWLQSCVSMRIRTRLAG